MVATTILYFLPENQSPKRSNGACGPPSPAWQGLQSAGGVCPSSDVSPLHCRQRSACSCSDHGGVEWEGVCAAVANASRRDRGLSGNASSSKVYRSSGRPGYGARIPMARCLLSSLGASLRPLLREVLELGYDVVEAAHSYEGLQAADVARSRRASRWTQSVSHRLVTWVRPDAGPKETPACHEFWSLMMTRPSASYYV